MSKLLHMCDYRCNRCKSRDIKQHIRAEELFCNKCYNIQRTGAVEHTFMQYMRAFQKPFKRSFQPNQCIKVV